MSIYDPVPKTVAQQVAEEVRESSQKLLQGEKNRCLSAFTKVWGGFENPKPIEECQNIIDEIGHADFIQALQVHAKWQEFIYTADQTYVPLAPPYDIGIDEAGVVTLTEKEV